MVAKVKKGLTGNAIANFILWIVFIVVAMIAVFLIVKKLIG